MGFTTIASRWMSRSMLFSRLILSLLLLSLMLGVRPVNAERGTRVGANAKGVQVTTSLPPVAVDDSGPGFVTTNHLLLRTANVLANDSDPAGRRLSVQSFNASGAKGDFTLLDPYPDSSLDTSFGVGGLVTTTITRDNQIGALLIQPDNKIVAGGSVQDGFGNSSFALARYNSDGSPDTSFNTTGFVTTRFNTSNHSLWDMFLQPDGKIVAVGTAEPFMAVARYTPNGSLDTSFSGDGMVTTSLGNQENSAYAGALQTDGKILITGYADGDFALFRLNTNGSFDKTFSGDGKLTTDFGGNDCGLSVLVQPNGKIIVVGTFTTASDIYDNYVAIARYNSNGSQDTSFGVGGKVATILANPINFIQAVLQPDGKILATSTDTNDSNAVLVRYNTNGSLDTTFDADGMVTTAFEKPVSVNTVALQNGGQILIAGTYYQSSQFDVLLARYNTDGSLDIGFGIGGKVIVDFNGENDSANALAVQTDGKIVSGGIANASNTQPTSNFGLARFNLDGAYQTRNTFLYNPNGQFDTLAPGEQAYDTLTYTASNGILTDTATVTVTIMGGIDTYLPFAAK